MTLTRRTHRFQWVLVFFIDIFPLQNAFMMTASTRSQYRRIYGHVAPTFALPGGGFGSGGGGSSGGFSSKKKNKKVKSRKVKGRSSLLSEMEVPPKATLEKKQNKEDDYKSVKLDKWGLPLPTEDDLFPPMPEGTELISVDPSTNVVTLSKIRETMKDHIELDALYHRFDENGFELNPSPDRPPMKLRMLHQSPPVLAIDHFFTPQECKAVKEVALGKSSQSNNQPAPVQVQSATFSALAQSKRTSTSWFCYYHQVPTLLAKAHYVLGIPTLAQMEEPQIVRYKEGQEFSWHYDEVPANQLSNGGQRLVTLLVYLNDVAEGGGTVFRDLKDGASSNNDMLTMKPKEGSALLFFPAFKDGRPDDRTLHKGEVAGKGMEKWIIQMWIHERSYRATIPEGNFQSLAQEAVDDVAKSLGYQ